MDKRCCGIRGKLKENSEFEYQTCPNQQTDISTNRCNVGFFSGMEVNVQSPEIVETFCYFGDARAKVKAVNNVVTRIVTWSNLEIYCLW